MPQIAPHPRVVAKLAPADGKRARYTFIGIPGLQLDCIPNGTPLGNRVWRVRYYLGEAEKIDTLGTLNENDREGYITLAKATELAAERRRLVKIDGIDPRNKGMTFDTLFNRWVESHAKVKKKSWKNDIGLYGLHIAKRLGGREVATLKRRDLIDVLDGIAADVSGVQANRCQTLISSVLNWALAEDLIDTSPSHGIRQRGDETPRERVMSNDELKAFWSALTPSPVDNALRLLLLLGQRRDEVGRASASELSAETWSLPGGLKGRTKNKLPHSVPLTPLARSLFGDGFSFYPTTLSHRFRDIVRSLEMPDIRLHDLRHCCATGMASLGIPREIRERVQNQVTGQRQSIGSRYDQHDYLPDKRRALTLWEQRLSEIVQGLPPSGLKW